jgi:hypothetical protein
VRLRRGGRAGAGSVADDDDPVGDRVGARVERDDLVRRVDGVAVGAQRVALALDRAAADLILGVVPERKGAKGVGDAAVVEQRVRVDGVVVEDEDLADVAEARSSRRRR